MVLNIMLSRSIIFPILVTLMILSVVCSLFIFYHFARSRELRKRLNNHVILGLLAINFIQVIVDLPLALIQLHTGFVFIQTSSFCTFWIVFNYSICVMGLMIMAYGCVERHFLVFHTVFFKRHLILLHYGPLFFFLIYPPLLYIGFIVIYKCESYFDYTQFTCGGSCYQYEFSLGLFDWFCNICTPVIISVIASVILMIRVFLQKRLVNQRRIWYRNRKMVFQLTTVSIMYVVVWIPIVIGFVIPIINPNSTAIDISFNILIYLEYIACLLCPFMSLLGLPEICNSIKREFIRVNTIRPMTQNS